MTGSIFVDAQKMAKRHPSTFYVPTKAQLAAIAPGAYVKVCAGTERFWVEVKSVNGSKIAGRIDNDLVCTSEHSLNCGDDIEFEPRHVYQILQPQKGLE